MRGNVITLLAILSGMIAAFFANYALLYPLIIPDPCYYHSRETTFVFDMFYSMDSADGDHPFPTTFNLFFTLFIGGVSGFLLLGFIRKKIAKD
ncbi:MAG: hypothetical protein V4685_07160 [Bacteroidota bacterium]